MNVKQACTFLTEMAQAYPFHAEDINEVIARLRAPAALPEGFVLMPIRATDEMVQAAEGVEDLYRRGTPETWRKVYAAFVQIAAAPAPSGVSAPAAVGRMPPVWPQPSDDYRVEISSAPAPNAQPSELPKPPSDFIDYVRRNYYGTVEFADPEWHAVRLWNAAMHNARAALAHAQSDALDFTPDAKHTVADMANIGYRLMQEISRHHPDFSWNESPAEIVGDLLEAQSDSAGDARDAARYRWLRDSETQSLVFVHPNDDDLFGDELDAAIDAASAAKGEQQ